MRTIRMLAVLVLLGTVSHGAFAQTIEDRGRAILERHKDAVVTIQLVIKQKMSMMGMGSQEDESKEEATGVVIAPDGLTVMSLTTTDPSGLLGNVMSGMGDLGDSFHIESTVSEAKILAADGTEVPAKIVLRDKDLDLAFVRPLAAPAAPLASIDLSDAGQPKVLDPLIALNRLGRVANRAYAASIERVHAIVEKPRTFYVPGSDPTHSGLGSPAFTAEGEFVGIMAMRSIKGGGGGGGGLGGMMGMMGGGLGDSVMPIVVPASDIAEVAAQAPSVDKVPDEPVEEPTEPDENAPKKSDEIVLDGAGASNT